MTSTPDELKISLAAARVNVNLKQQDVADVLHVAKSTVISWEKGKSAPSVNQAIKLCEIYQRPMDSIFFGA